MLSILSIAVLIRNVSLRLPKTLTGSPMLCCICCQLTFHVEATTPLSTSPFCFLSFGRSELCRLHLCCSLQRSRIPWMLCLAQRDQVPIVPGWTTGQWFFTRLKQSFNTSHKTELPKNWLSTVLMENSGKTFTFQLLPVFARKTPSLVQGQHISHRHLVLLQQRSNAGGMTTHLAGMAPNPDTVTHGKAKNRPSSCSCWQKKTLWHLNAGIQQIAIAWAFIHLLRNLCCNVHRPLLDRLERVPKNRSPGWDVLNASGALPGTPVIYMLQNPHPPRKNKHKKSTPLWCQDLVEHELESLDASKDVHHRHFDMDFCQAWPCPAPDPETPRNTKKMSIKYTSVKPKQNAPR